MQLSNLTSINQKLRFSLHKREGEKEDIVMIHCAIMGSIERFMSVLIEHYAGVFPFWLSPVQTKFFLLMKIILVLLKGFEALKKVGIRAELDNSNEGLGKKFAMQK